MFPDPDHHPIVFDDIYTLKNYNIEENKSLTS